MKKAISVFLMLLMLLSVLTGCGNQGKTNNDTDKLSIVTTIFPEYDWVRNILGDSAESAEITMLMDNGVDLHSYQPTADDMVKISDCDLFIYVGGESDGWVEDALANAINKDMKVINLLEVLGDAVKAEEMVEGMQEGEHSHEHSHEEIHEKDIEDRTLSDFSGEWNSLYPVLVSGKLDSLLEKMAKEYVNAVTKEQLFEKYKTSWACEADKIIINGDNITYVTSDGKTMTAKYTYAGFSLQRDDDGDITSVRYQFETASAKAPKYIQFSDHGYRPGKAEHFHAFFGNDGFDALSVSKEMPSFVEASLTLDEIVEGLDEHNHEHSHEEGEDGHEHEEEMDEHVWLSLKNASVLVSVIGDAISELDPSSKDIYISNVASYVKKLNTLDADYQEMVSSARFQTVLFGDRFPFRYLVDDYDLDYYAAFVGCSAETEASFETISFLATKIDELELPCVLTIEKPQHKIAETVVQNTSSKNQTILALNSMQSTTSADVENGVTYLSLMEENLNVLKSALNG